MAVVVGGVSIDLTANASSIIAEMDRSGKAVQRASRQMTQSTSRWRRAFGSAERGIITGARRISRSFAGIARSLGPVVGLAGGAGVAGFAAMARRSLEAADAIAKAADRAGIGTDAFQALSFQASQTGVAQEQLNTALVAFGRRVAEARAGGGPLVSTLQRLNPELLAAVQNSRDNAQALRIVADAMGRAEDRGQALAIAQAAFSEAGRNLVLTFRDGASSIDDFAGRARDLGLIIDEELLRNAESANDALDVLSQVISVRMTSAIAEAAPEIQRLATAFAESIDDIAAAGQAIVEFGAALGQELIQRIRTTKKEFDALVEAFEALTSGSLAGSLGGISIDEAQRRATARAADDFARLNDVMTGTKELFDQLGLSARKAAEEIAAVPAGPTGAAVPAAAPEPFRGAPPIPPRVDVGGERIQFRRQQLEEESRRNEARQTAVIPGTGQRVVDDRRAAADRFQEQLSAADEEARQVQASMDRIGQSAATVGAAIAGWTLNESSFADAARSIIQNLIRMAIQAAVSAAALAAVQSAIGDVGAGARAANTAATVSSALASVVAGGGQTTGFQHGGSFKVGGSGGPDSKLVAFNATPGERVDVTPLSERESERGKGDLNIAVDARGATPGMEQRIEEAVARGVRVANQQMMSDVRRRPGVRQKMGIR